MAAYHPQITGLGKFRIFSRVYSDVSVRSFTLLNLTLRLMVCLVLVTSKPANWYNYLHRALRWFVWVYSSFKPLRKPRKIIAVYLNRMLGYASRSGVEFPIPARVSGSERLVPGAGHLICGTHLPLNKVGLTALFRMGLPVDAAIAAEPDPDMRMAIWGTTHRIEALKADEKVLIRARRLLKQGAFLAVMVDRRHMATVSANSLKLAALCGVESSLIRSVLQEDGSIYVELLPMPCPHALDDQGLSANIDFIRNGHEEVETGYLLSNYKQL